MLAVTLLPSLVLALCAFGSPVAPSAQPSAVSSAGDYTTTAVATSYTGSGIASSSPVPTYTTTAVSSGVASSYSGTGGATSYSGTGVASSGPVPTYTTTGVSSGIATSYTTVPTTAAPVPTGNPCNALIEQCRISNPSPNYSNVYYEPSCVAAVICYNGVPADAVISTLSGLVTPAAQQPRLSKTLFDFFSSDKKVWTQQNYIDFFYSTLGRKEAPGPWPSSVATVIAQWEYVVAWTGFCGTRAVPYANLADWLQYSSTHSGAKSCGGAVSSAVPSAYPSSSSSYIGGATTVTSYAGGATSVLSSYIGSATTVTSYAGGATSASTSTSYVGGGTSASTSTSYVGGGTVASTSTSYVGGPTSASTSTSYVGGATSASVGPSSSAINPV